MRLLKKKLLIFFSLRNEIDLANIYHTSHFMIKHALLTSIIISSLINIMIFDDINLTAHDIFG